MEGEMEGQAKEFTESHEDRFLSYSKDEEGEIALQEEPKDEEVPLENQDIENWCKHFVDFMQAQLHKKYDLRSLQKENSRARTKWRVNIKRKNPS